MPYYKATGKDTSSDDNYFVVVVKSQNRTDAYNAVGEHLKAKGRTDLVFTTLDRVYPAKDQVLFSSVEPKH